MKFLKNVNKIFPNNIRQQLKSTHLPPIVWADSSVGRIPALHAGGQGFKSPSVHKIGFFNKNFLIAKIEIYFVFNER